LNRELPFIEGDILDTDLLIEALKKYEIDSVIHFAGLKSVGESAEDPLTYYLNNVQGTLSLLNAMRTLNVNKLVFSSSATVYGDPQYLPIDENHPIGATNAYGRTKLYVESILRDLVCSDPAWKIICLRYFNPVGAHQSGLIGEESNAVPSNLMPYIAQVAAGVLPELNVYGLDYPTPDGTGVRDYIHILDLVSAHLLAVQSLHLFKGFEIFNLGTGHGYSVLEVLRAFEISCGKKIPFLKKSRRPGDVAACVASSTKAERELGWLRAYTLQDMCDSTWKFYSSKL
jgi:UDP-glucose 4-epimerase